MPHRQTYQPDYQQQRPDYQHPQSNHPGEVISHLRERVVRMETVLEEYRVNWHHIRNRMTTQEDSRNNIEVLLAELRYQQRDIEREIRELRAMQKIEEARPDVFQTLAPWAKILVGALATVIAFVVANPALLRRLMAAIFPP